MRSGTSSRFSGACRRSGAPASCCGAGRLLRPPGGHYRLPRPGEHGGRCRLVANLCALWGAGGGRALANRRAQPCGCRRHGRGPRRGAGDRGPPCARAGLKGYHLLPSVRGDLLHKLGGRDGSAAARAERAAGERRRATGSTRVDPPQNQGRDTKISTFSQLGAGRRSLHPLADGVRPRNMCGEGARSKRMVGISEAAFVRRGYRLPARASGCRRVSAIKSSRRHARNWSRRRAIDRLGERIGIGPDAVDFLREQLDRLNQASVSAQLEQSFPRLPTPHSTGERHHGGIAMVKTMTNDPEPFGCQAGVTALTAIYKELVFGSCGY